MRVTVKYGTGNEITKDIMAGTTIGCVIGNSTIRTALGYGQNVAGHVGGVPQNDNVQIFDGIVISVADKACQKAGRTLTITVELPDGEPVPKSAEGVMNLFAGIDGGQVSAEYKISVS